MAQGYEIQEIVKNESVFPEFNFINSEQLDERTLINIEEYMGGDDDDSGTIIGNGGDITKCEGKTYFTDYYLSIVANQISGIPYYDFQAGNISKVIKALYTVSPQAAASLESFTKSFLKLMHLTQEAPLRNIEDELPGLFGMLWSVDCTLEQAVRRAQYDDYLIYEFDYGLIRELDQTNLSWLIVHEWLWNFYDNSEDIFVTNEQLQLFAVGIPNAMTIKLRLNHIISIL